MQRTNELLQTTKRVEPHCDHELDSVPHQNHFVVLDLDKREVGKAKKTLKFEVMQLEGQVFGGALSF